MALLRGQELERPVRLSEVFPGGEDQALRVHWRVDLRRGHKKEELGFTTVVDGNHLTS